MIKPLLTGGLSECCRLSLPVTLLAVYLGLAADGARVTALPQGVIVPGKGNFFYKMVAFQSISGVWPITESIFYTTISSLFLTLADLRVGAFMKPIWRIIHSWCLSTYMKYHVFFLLIVTCLISYLCEGFVIKCFWSFFPLQPSHRCCLVLHSFYIIYWLLPLYSSVEHNLDPFLSAMTWKQP